jgi:ribosomal-protein-alanine N-acetyltransferase
LSERLVLRDFTEDDFGFYKTLETTDARIAYEADCIPNEEELRAKFNETLGWIQNDIRKKYSLIVEDRLLNKPVGRLVIWSSNRAIQEWEMGWIIHDQYMNKGYATEGAKRLLDYAFETLEAHRVMASCNAENLGSERVMQKIGMIKEGVFRETRQLGGEWYGSCIYSILRDEWSQSC